VPCTCDDDLGDHRIFDRTVGAIIDAFRLMMTLHSYGRPVRERTGNDANGITSSGAESDIFTFLYFFLSSFTRNSRLQHEDKPHLIVTVVPRDGDLDITSQKDRIETVTLTNNTVFSNNSSNSNNFLWSLFAQLSSGQASKQSVPKTIRSVVRL
jgi:hypothetical protein